MKIDKKYISIMIVSLITVVIYSVLNNSAEIMRFIKSIFSHFTIFVMGAVIAFLLNPVLNFLEKKLKLSRKVSMVVIYLSLIALAILCVLIIVPNLLSNISDLIRSIPEFMIKLENMLNKLSWEISTVMPFLNSFMLKMNISKINDYAISVAQDSVKSIGRNLLDLSYLTLKMAIGFVMSAFFLGEKEYFKNLFAEVVKVNFSKENNEKIIFYSKKIYEIFLGYFQGKTLESLLIGFIAFLGLLYFKVPYAMFLWIFITMTNFIPYFGPFLGMAATAIISAFVFPEKVVSIVVFMVVLQQIDSWYFEPKIIGNRLNLKMFWGIAAITIGGSIAGPVGIVLSAPLASFIKTMYKLKKDEFSRNSDN